MKKRSSVNKLQDQIGATEYRAKRRDPQPTAKAHYADPNPLKTRRRISYVPGVPPRDEPSEIPRLFVRGLTGGSIKMDLRGLGIEISEAAFAHWVADDSLKDLGICRGDLALIDPFREILREGNLILLELNGCAVLRLLTKKSDVWYLEAVDQANPDPVALWAHPFQGVVLGFTRLFTKVKATSYRGTEANFRNPYEQSGLNRKISSTTRKSTKAPAHHKAFLPKTKRAKFLLAGESRPPYLAPEREKKPRYSRRAKIR